MIRPTRVVRKLTMFTLVLLFLWRPTVRVWTFKSCSVRTPGNSPHRALSFVQQLLMHQRPRIITHRLTLLWHLTNPLAHVSQNVHPNIDAGATGNDHNLSFHWLGIWNRFWSSTISSLPVTTASM